MSAPVSKSYFDKIATEESGGLEIWDKNQRKTVPFPLDDPSRYGINNQYDYLGKYQMGTGALKQAGLYNGIRPCVLG